jgi:hypothetical protein
MISLTAQAVNASMFPSPIATSGLMGPVRFAVVLALLIRYRPTPKKLSAEPFGSPVPT